VPATGRGQVVSADSFHVKYSCRIYHGGDRHGSGYHEFCRGKQIVFFCTGTDSHYCCIAEVFGLSRGPFSAGFLEKSNL